MKHHFLKTFLLSTAISCLFFLSAFGQTFKPDANGYVADPKFHQLIRSRGYQLVGAFETLSVNPLKVAAEVLKADKWFYIDCAGKVLPDVVKRNPEDDFMEFGGENPGRSYGDLETPPMSGERYNKKQTHHRYRNYRMVHINGKYGLEDGDNNTTILEAKYDKLKLPEIDENTVLICLDGLWGVYLADVKKELIAPQYESIELLSKGSDHPATTYAFKQNGLFGILDATGKQTVPPKYTTIRQWDMGGQVLKFAVDEKYGLLDRNGKEVIPPRYDFIDRFGKYGEAVVGIGTYPSFRMGIIDTEGNEIVPLGDHKVRFLETGKYLVETGSEPDKRTGLFNAVTRKEIFPPTYGFIGPFNNGRSWVSLQTPQGTRYGFIDTTGKVIVPLIYQGTDNMFRAGLIVARNANETFLIDENGKVLLKTDYDRLKIILTDDPESNKDYHPSRLMFTKDNKFGVIDLQGKVIIPALYDEIDPENGTYCVRIGSKKGFVSATGKVLIPVQYEKFGMRSKGIINARKAGRNCRVDLYGGEVCE